tara:strand:- start:3669 stop:4973 length:1305 start_codon:yes stop_codon:yes gene_type:complete
MPYYINAPTLSLATAVYDDPQLTICSADGYYADGPVVRQQADCVLLPVQQCPFCGAECGCSFSGPVNKGVYYFSVELGAGIGPAAIRFAALDFPNGIEATYDSTVYNSVVSPTFGLLSAPSGLPVFIGLDTQDCGIVGAHVLDEFEFRSFDNSFYRLGTTDTVNVIASQSQLTFSDPGTCLMVIPKPNATPSNLLIKVISPCDLDSFDITTYCPGDLEVFSIAGNSEGGSEELICGYPSGDLTYYIIPINGDGVTLGFYDLLYYDAACSVPLADNYYLSLSCPAPNNWFRIENGIIVEFGECGDTFVYAASRCADGLEIIVTSTSVLALGTIVSVTDPIYSGCKFTIDKVETGTPVTAVDESFPGTTCEDYCAYYKVYNTDFIPATVNYIDCLKDPQTVEIPVHTFTYICAQINSITSAQSISAGFESCQCAES